MFGLGSNLCTLGGFPSDYSLGAIPAPSAYTVYAAEQEFLPAGWVADVNPFPSKQHTALQHKSILNTQECAARICLGKQVLVTAIIYCSSPGGKPNTATRNDLLLSEEFPRLWVGYLIPTSTATSWSNSGNNKRPALSVVGAAMRLAIASK
jgi:hypothetical protein